MNNYKIIKSKKLFLSDQVLFTSVKFKKLVSSNSILDGLSGSGGVLQMLKLTKCMFLLRKACSFGKFGRRDSIVGF